MLITFSGIDGSGKSSLAKYIAFKLRRLGYNAEYCCPEYNCNNIMKDFCKKIFNDSNAYIPKLNSDLYINGLFLDWLDLLNQKLNNHKSKFLVCDRYILDVIAQGIHYNANLKPIVELIKYFPIPDIAFYLKSDPLIAFARLVKRESPPIHKLESLDNLYILEKGYIKAKKYFNYPIIDIESNKSLTIIKSDLLKKLINKL